MRCRRICLVLTITAAAAAPTAQTPVDGCNNSRTTRATAAELRRRARERRPGHDVCAPPPRWLHIGGGSGVAVSAGARARPREDRSRELTVSSVSLCLCHLSFSRTVFSALTLSFSLSRTHGISSSLSSLRDPATLLQSRIIFLYLSYARYLSFSPVRASDLSVSNLESGRGGHSGLRDLRPSVRPSCLFSHRDQSGGFLAVSFSLSLFLRLPRAAPRGISSPCDCSAHVFSPSRSTPFEELGRGDDAAHVASACTTLFAHYGAAIVAVCSFELSSRCTTAIQSKARGLRRRDLHGWTRTRS